MGELRRNPVTGRWISVAPHRAHRPSDSGRRGASEGLPPHDPGCPFCPGNESELPEILWEAPAEGSPGWRVRAVSNRYPAFREPDGSEASLLRALPEETASGLSATGHQEVIIESPRHDARLATLDPVEMEAVLEAHHARYSAHVERDPRTSVLLFRNQGRPAGASLLHPHSQLMALPFAPPAAAEREERLAAFHRKEGRCLLCGEGGDGPARREGRVAETGEFTVLVPWAAEVPLEVWIVPRRHAGGFEACGSGALKELAGAVRRVLRCYRTLAGDPDYNYLLHSSPPARSGRPGQHWFVQLRPRVQQMAGFELGSGILINPSLPEADAEALREAWKGEAH